MTSARGEVEHMAELFTGFAQAIIVGILCIYLLVVLHRRAARVPALSLFIVPVLFTLIDDLQNRLQRRPLNATPPQIPVVDPTA